MGRRWQDASYTNLCWPQTELQGQQALLKKGGRRCGSIRTPQGMGAKKAAESQG